MDEKPRLSCRRPLNIMFDCALMTRRRLVPTFYVKPTDITAVLTQNHFSCKQNKVANRFLLVIVVSASTKEVLVIEQSSTLARCGERRIENK